MYHLSFALLDGDMLLNDASAFLPTSDPSIWPCSNSPLFWWYAFRVFPHMKDETIAMDQALVGATLVARPSSLRITAASCVDEIRAAQRTSRLEWLELTTALASA